MHRFAILLGIALFLSTQTTLAQNASGTVADSVRALYQSLEHDAAEVLAREAIEGEAFASIDELADLHFFLGLVRFIRSDSLTARADFETVLSLEHEFRPDPVLVPPRALSFFERVRESFVEHTPSETPPVIRYVTVYDPRPSAALRSVVLPGWGQRYRGDYLAGGFLTAGWVTTAGSALAISVFDDPDQREWETVRNVALVSAGAIWLFAYIDALLTPSSRPAAPGNVRVSPRVSAYGTGVAGSFRL